MRRRELLGLELEGQDSDSPFLKTKQSGMSKFRTNSTDVQAKEEMSSRDESGDEFIPDIRPTQTTSIYHLVPDMKIKLEVVDFHRNTTADSEDHFNMDLDTVPAHDPLHIDPASTGHDSSQGDLSQLKGEVDDNIDQKDFQHNSTSAAEDDSNRDLEPAYVAGSTIPHVDNDSVKTEQRYMNQINLDFLQNADAEDCETCQKYLRMLSEHIRVSHASSQPNRNPLLIDPLNIDPDPHHAEQSSSIEIKYEVHDGIEKMECSEFKEESETNDPDFVLESESERDPDYSPSTHMTRNVHLQNLHKEGWTDSMSLIVRESKKQFKCNQCGKSLTTKRDLTVHMRIHTGERPYKCDVCEKCFAQQNSLTGHKRSHTGERPYMCDLCGKSFITSGDLNKHKRIHTGERPHKCDLCVKSFTASSDLTKHKRVHTGERPYKCDVCEKSFKLSRTLCAHKKIHTGEKPYKCGECAKSFLRSHDLTVHIRVHTGVKPYECTVCEKKKRFTRLTNLNQHNRAVHSGVRPYKCNVCETSFKMSSHLTKHRRTHNVD